MGGSGGGSYSYSEIQMEKLREEAGARLERSRLDSEINGLLQRELAQINDRDTDTVNRYLDEIEEAIRDKVDVFERIVLAGSVAKHTYVDGLSDIDSLVVLDESVVGERTPEQVRSDLRDILNQQLNMGAVQGIEVGRLSVTVKYRDGTEIQLLPAVQRGDSVAISSPGGDEWVGINPKEFSSRLTHLNNSQAGAVVPAIKIAKAIVANTLPEAARRPSGYHMEALALSAFGGYDGPRTPKALAQRFFDIACQDVLRPISDVTGQSRHIDASLGNANSPSRRAIARHFAQIAKQMRDASSASEWQRLLDE